MDIERQKAFVYSLQLYLDSIVSEQEITKNVAKALANGDGASDDFNIIHPAISLKFCKPIDFGKSEPRPLRSWKDGGVQVLARKVNEFIADNWDGDIDSRFLFYNGPSCLSFVLGSLLGKQITKFMWKPGASVVLTNIPDRQMHAPAEPRLLELTSTKSEEEYDDDDHTPCMILFATANASQVLTEEQQAQIINSLKKINVHNPYVDTFSQLKPSAERGRVMMDASNIDQLNDEIEEAMGSIETFLLHHRGNDRKCVIIVSALPQPLNFIMGKFNKPFLYGGETELFGTDFNNQVYSLLKIN